MGLLEARSVIVTGAASGIGRAAAMLFAAEGAKLTIADIDEAALGETLAAIEKAGGAARARRTDVARPEDAKALVQAALDAWGGLDGAFNNAGVDGDWARTLECTEENYARVIAINQTGVFHCMRAEIPPMIERGGGAIVNTASIAGIAGASYMPAYVASKHGVVGLTKSAAMEYARKNVRVNAVCPGPIETPMLARIGGNRATVRDVMVGSTAMRRLGRPAEIAEAACWLLSDRASYVTGVTLPVDGGMVAGP